jgi:hypothetical protein
LPVNELVDMVRRDGGWQLLCPAKKDVHITPIVDRSASSWLASPPVALKAIDLLLRIHSVTSMS